MACDVELAGDGCRGVAVEREIARAADDGGALLVVDVLANCGFVYERPDEFVAVGNRSAEAFAALELAGLTATDMSGEVIAVLVGHLAGHADEGLVGDVGIVLDGAQRYAVATQVVEDLTESARLADATAAACEARAVKDPQLGMAVLGSGGFRRRHCRLKLGSATTTIAGNVLLAERLGDESAAPERVEPGASGVDLGGDTVLRVR